MATEQQPNPISQNPAPATEALSPKPQEVSIESQTNHEEKIQQYRVTDIFLTVFNGLLVLLTFFLVIVGFKQARGTALAANAATNANEIARKTVQITQRAYVKISHVPPGLAISSNVFTVTVEISNLGPTPATVTDVILAYRFLLKDEPLPNAPEYFPSTRELAPNVFLYKDDKFTYVSKFDIRAEDLADLDRKDWYLFGYVDYIDQFRQRYRAGYARKYIPRPPDQNNLVLVIKNGYNYDRPRKRDEGHDWEDPL